VMSMKMVSSSVTCASPVYRLLPRFLFAAGTLRRSRQVLTTSMVLEVGAGWTRQDRSSLGHA